MYEIEFTNKFKKDVKLSQKRGLDISLLNTVIETLELTGELPSENKPHKLSGNYSGLWECHIQSDWLLIWDQEDPIRLIRLLRTGTHSDLF